MNDSLKKKVDTVRQWAERKGQPQVAEVLKELSAEIEQLEAQAGKQSDPVAIALSTLSYSETVARKIIFSEMKGTEDLLVASKVADVAGITRSVIVNALRKLEAAGVIESRSLGMKGTRIKILIPGAKQALAS